VRRLPQDLRLALHRDLDAIEAEWRRFERAADCTAFQTFDWLATWQRHVGVCENTGPVIAVASFADGAIAFMLPLAIEAKRSARRLCWLGQDLNDYNAPLLAKDFSERVTPDRFLAAWRELCARMQRDPMLRYDWIELEKMPEMVGGQVNPFFHLALAANPSGAHFTLLGDDWNTFYEAKRSSSTRRRDRTKRKHMSAFGDIVFRTCPADDVPHTLQTLMEQKRRLFAHKGIPDMFAQPGWREFFLDIATNPATRHLVHVSHVRIGETFAAANLGAVFGDTYYHMLASYDDGELARYGPGALHLRELLAYAIGQKLRRFDFTIGDEPYKLEWSDVHVKLRDYTAAATWRGWPAWLQSSLRRPVKRYIKQTPWAWRIACQYRSLVGSLFRRPQPASEPARPAAAALSSSRPPFACVMGDMDLLRPIASAGIRCAVVTRPGVPSLYSRFAQARLCWSDFSADAETLVDQLVRFGRAQSEPPVLFYEEDAQLLMISRFREQLKPAFRFIVADAPLVEDLVDKARFQLLAERHALPVPAARLINPASSNPDDLDLVFPVVLKPLTRLTQWNEKIGLRKALSADSAEALRAVWPLLQELDGGELLAQELIAGAEARIESYHCYVDRLGSIAGEFTGRKIRTHPSVFGHTTALEITDAADVRRQGRTIAERLGLTGVAKFDFKRDPHGTLRLLEVNPRFTLWHHAGALAGVNIPAMVFADLTGTPRPQAVQARPGVRWCRVWSDFPAARAAGVPLGRWLAWILRCEAKSSLSWDDPLPFARSAYFRLIGRHIAQAAGRSPNGQHWIGS
jgi:D-aspartate ligase